MQPLMITCAMVGAEITREQTPYLPISAEEIAADAEACWKAGAAVVHIHVRDSGGRPTQDPEVFAEAERQIRQRCDVIVQYTTGGAVGTPVERRLAPLLNRPEMATLTTGTVNFGDEIFENPWSTIEALARKMLELDVRPELEIFDFAMVDNALRLIHEGLLRAPYHFDFVLGVPGALSARPEHLVHLVSLLPANSTWQVAAVGRHQLPLTTMAMAMGGHVRVGLEDNIYYSKGVLAKNFELVARAARIAQELGRPLMTPTQARKALGMASEIPG
jgi:3-keto-5-aminohexanoate cleavage enzyme